MKTPFYRVLASMQMEDKDFSGEFRAVSGSRYYNSPLLYKDNGFSERTSAIKLISELAGAIPQTNDDGTWNAISSPQDTEKLMAEVSQIEKKKEVKNPPLLFNLAELQNECSRLFKISPDETLKHTQELYEKKLVTYPRTDARVLSTAVSKEIYKNIKGLMGFSPAREFAAEILESGTYKNIAKTRYCNDSQITDHYAIIPTGQGLNTLNTLSMISSRVYEAIVKRFLSIFYPAAEYKKIGITVKIKGESFFASCRILDKEGYLKVAGNANDKDKASSGASAIENPAVKDKEAGEEGDYAGEEMSDRAFLELLMKLKKGMLLPVSALTIKEGETSAPKRYNSGSLILAMENAGQLIEDEELRAQIKGSGIGTSATRAEILNKLVTIAYLNLNKKTQIITPTLLGELIYEVVNTSIKSLLNAELTASWEKGLTYVSEGQITKEEYMGKLESFVIRMVNGVKTRNNQAVLMKNFNDAAEFYKK